MADGPDREALLAELSALSATATSDDGAVSLSVNTDGVLTRLRLTDAVSGMSPAEIADAVLRTYVSAQRESAKRTGQLLAPLGSGGYLMDRLRWRVQFEPEPAPVAAPPRAEDSTVLKDRSSDAPPVAPPPSGPVPDDDYYGKGMRFEQAW
ncbi:YbaB/EbfC family nucleoid-associated protein [Amycolatopsis sp. SID8362]|uniref:YbaB/EbfC family nucleoid-associated protein n=1 Tax=Amycolatopsis sp. SID8362 TaxID=2690346 RepID=UPI00136FEAA1|nr:YbaB/EbfC family nucleoid-associated protein [Amycolatopsis sp. SID8362]NBH04424.1 YbaB/EbfC family DNA-binding protein [Amycolatopsis sp. SID8362]NED41123.1 YbaB/EbfC family nucleoid-associated protein [Amycolatopsis sp. SID8362]